MGGREGVAIHRQRRAFVAGGIIKAQMREELGVDRDEMFAWLVLTGGNVCGVVATVLLFLGVALNWGCAWGAVAFLLMVGMRFVLVVTAIPRRSKRTGTGRR